MWLNGKCLTVSSWVQCSIPREKEREGKERGKMGEKLREKRKMEERWWKRGKERTSEGGLQLGREGNKGCELWETRPSLHNKSPDNIAV